MSNRLSTTVNRWLVIIDRFRPVPRFIMLMAMVFLYHVADWFMALSAPTPEQAAFAASVVAGVLGCVKIYIDGKPLS